MSIFFAGSSLSVCGPHPCYGRTTNSLKGGGLFGFDISSMSGQLERKALCWNLKIYDAHADISQGSLGLLHTTIISKWDRGSINRSLAPPYLSVMPLRRPLIAIREELPLPCRLDR
jgi:hypothetical protein